MSDATERGGAMASVYRQISKKDGGVIRIDKNEALKAAEKSSTARGSGRNQPMAKTQSSKPAGMKPSKKVK